VIAHDLSSLAGIADRVAVFYRSRLVEQGPTRDVLENPAHPYTALLTASAPSVERHHTIRPSDVRRDAEPDEERTGWTAAGGCVFAARCRFVHDACRVQPELVALDPSRLASSHLTTSTPTAREAACYVAGEWNAHLTQEIA